MRSFSDFEKFALNIIVKDNPLGMCRQNLETLVNNVFAGKKVEFHFDHASRKLIAKYYLKDKHDDFTQVNSIANNLIELMVLIEYLNSLYLFRLYHLGGSSSSLNKDCPDREGILVTQETGLIVYEFYNSHWNDFFYVSDELRHVVKDNRFRTDEQLYVEEQLKQAKLQTLAAQKQIRSSKIAIIIAILALASSIVLPFLVEMK